MAWGLCLVHDEPDHDAVKDIAVDIIAVHGLGAHPDHAWVRQKDAAAGVTADVRWLTDLLTWSLREYQPSIRARVFCYNYQSAWLGFKLSKNRLEAIAGRLLDDIHHLKIQDAREQPDGGVSDRPLIFIGHSFGGLVIEQAVVKANSAGGTYEYLVNLIGGVLLLGTPHWGSKTQKWGTILARLASLMEYGETVLMDDVDEKSMKIFDLVCDFMKIMIRTDLAQTNAAMCFYENLPTDYARRWTTVGWIGEMTSAIVVDETSAVLPGFHNVVLDSDHLKLNKFSSAMDTNYKSVSSNLARIAARAPQLIQSRRREAAATQERYFEVSRKRVEGFVGRENQLREIMSHFSASQATRPRCLILHALGGQGKSQIALEYCRRLRETYRGVFWVNASSALMVRQSYHKIAAALMGASTKTLNDDDAIARVVKGHLEEWNERWLLVFDNYDEPDNLPSIRDFIPTGGRGDILFTSRSRGLGRLGKLLEIPMMTTEEAICLLLRAHDHETIQPHLATASEIVTRLGGLPLAIDQAAAYIEYKHLPLNRLDEFLATYEIQRRKVLDFIPKRFWEYGTMQIHGEAEQNKAISAFTTWEMSLQQLEWEDKQRKEDVSHFLTLSAFLEPTKIGELLFRHYWEEQREMPAWIYVFSRTDELDFDGDDPSIDKAVSHENEDRRRRGTWSSDEFWDVIFNLYELSLLQSISQGDSQEDASFSLHPLIRDWLQLQQSPESARKYVREAINFMLSSITLFEHSAALVEAKALLEVHLTECLKNDRRFARPGMTFGYDIADCDGADWFASFYRDRGRYEEAETIQRLVITTRTTVQGEEHPSTLISMNNLAGVLSHQGKYEQAEEIHRRTLELNETVLGKEHPNTLISMSNLASVLSDQGIYEQAEEIHRRTLELSETVLGKEHPDTLASMNNLAKTLSDQGKYNQAEETYRRTLELKEMVLGKEHPSTLASMNNLAEVLSAQGKYKEAEKIHRRTLELNAALLGKEHPSTLTSMNNLASVLSDQGIYEQAEETYRRTLELKETVLGKEHPSTLASMNNLAEVLSAQGNYKEAEKIHRRTLELNAALLGKEHPSTLNSMNNLALVLSDQGIYEQAEETYRRTLELKETVLGKEHPSTLISMNNLAELLSDQGKYEQAEEIHRQTLELNKTVLGKEHPSTLNSMNNLAEVLGNQDKYEQAEETHRRTLELKEAVLGKEHPSTLTSMNNLAEVLSAQSKYEQAEEINRRTLELLKTVLGKEHPLTLTSMNNLAEVLSAQSKYEQAEETHRRTLELLETVLGKEHPLTLTSMNNLAEVLSAQSKYEQAEETHRRTLELKEAVLGKEHPSTLTSMNNLTRVLSDQGKHEQAEEIYRRMLELR